MYHEWEQNPMCVKRRLFPLLCNSSARPIRQTHPRCFNPVLELFFLKSWDSAQFSGSHPEFWNFFLEKASVRPKSQMLYPGFGTFFLEKLVFDPNRTVLAHCFGTFSLKSWDSVQTPHVWAESQLFREKSSKNSGLKQRGCIWRIGRVEPLRNISVFHKK